MKTLTMAAIAATLLAATATASEQSGTVETGAAVHAREAARSGHGALSIEAAPPQAVHAAIAAPTRLEMPTMAGILQPADPGYDAWRARMDAARGKRRRGMIMTFGGLLGAPIVGGAVAGGSAAAGSEAGIGVGAMISLAGLGVGIWGIFEWINGHSDMGDIELDGERAGYVSIAPVRGGAVANLALSF